MDSSDEGTSFVPLKGGGDDLTLISEVQGVTSSNHPTASAVSKEQPPKTNVESLWVATASDGEGGWHDGGAWSTDGDNKSAWSNYEDNKSVSTTCSEIQGSVNTNDEVDMMVSDLGKSGRH